MYSIPFTLDLGIEYLIRNRNVTPRPMWMMCLFPLDLTGLTGLTYIGIKKFRPCMEYRIGPRSAPWKFGYDPVNMIGGEKGGEIQSPSLGNMVPLLEQVRYINLHYVYIVCEI